jgi:hypothetical protein
MHARKDDEEIAGEGVKLLKTLSFQAELSTAITKRVSGFVNCRAIPK